MTKTFEDIKLLMNKNSENLDEKNDELKETSELLSFIKKKNTNVYLKT